MPHDDFAFEPQEGLPERLPEDEILLWQGRPSAFALTRDALRFYWVVGFFTSFVVMRGIAVSDQVWAVLWANVMPLIILTVLLGLVLFVMGYIMARAALYTITTKRVVMRIGAAVNVTLNLPFTSILAADLAEWRSGKGSIVMRLKGDTRLSFLVCWPHLRPWRARVVEPSLRAIPNVRDVAQILGDAANTRLTEITETTPATVPVAGVPAE